MFGSFSIHRGLRAHASSKAEVEVEGEVIILLPSDHVLDFSSVILSDADSATPISRLLIFKMPRILPCSFRPVFSNHPTINIPL